MSLITFASAKPGLDAERAETYSRLGMKLARHKRFPDALVEFRRAEALIQYIEAPGILYGNIGFCLVQLDRRMDALAAFDEGLRRAKTDEIRARLTGHIERLQSEIFTHLSVRCDAPEVTVQVSGQAPQACPASWPRLPPGRHVIEGKAATSLSARAEVELAAGSAETISLTIPAGVRVASPVPGRVSINGIPYGMTPFETHQLTPGEHVVAVSTAKGAVWRSRVNAKPGQWLDLRAALDPPSVAAKSAATPIEQGDDDWLWTGIGVGAAVALGVGAYFLSSPPEAVPSAVATE